MAESRNFKELLQLLNERQVDYLIVGGYAVMRYAEPRFTKGLDIWVGHSADNSRRVFTTLARFGAPLRHDGVTEETFSVEQTVYQIGVPPVRVDILNTISGCLFEDARGRRLPGVMYGVPVHFISLADLIANKRAAGARATWNTWGFWGWSDGAQFLQLNPLEEPSSHKQQDHAESRQHSQIERRAEMRDSDEGTAQPIHAVGEGIDAGNDVERHGQIVERKQRAG